MTIPLVTLSIGVFVLAFVAWRFRQILHDARPGSPEQADAIVVLAAGLWKGKPSPAMRTRIHEALSLFRAGYAPVIFCSGGYDGEISEAGVMRTMLLDAGVSPDAVFADGGGNNTRQSLRHAAAFLGGAWHRILVVSSPYHVHRACREARRRGLDPVPCPADRPRDSNTGYFVYIARQYVREVIANFWYTTTWWAGKCLNLPVLRLLRSAWRQIVARLRALVSDVDAVFECSETIGIRAKNARPDVADTVPVLTPAAGIGWPVDGAIGDRFGLRHGRLHAGVDIRAPFGSRTVAAAPGIVIMAERLGPYGNLVVLDHQGGLSTVYGHLASSVVSEGDEITAGGLLGFVGTTGRSSGPHLHFEVRVHGTPVDPTAYLRCDSDPGAARAASQ